MSEARRSARTSQVKTIVRFRKQTWAWQRLMRTPLTPKRRPEPALERPGVPPLGTRALAQARRRGAAQGAQPARLRAWLCIKRHEGPWNDPHAPYYGGLQMDLTFQRLYGADLLRRKGTANRWKPIEQIWVAERAHRSGRGFHPWPTRRAPAASSDRLRPRLRVHRLRVHAAGGALRARAPPRARRAGGR